ncbi:M23 family metallopeptidase [Arthrobacter russicus]|jgi:murein DD-endopeptidase MepM/ murein hydrolase activator NlpD|uniref:Murein DD-endopeptidase MepM/ murein hydrolase activator NlpD n=1 Tax=Arthrobacter russicus TaxID=172040 RepID=A0ABU1JE28_9MICC|nr:M23 family metallopeptidase [Arthrobacter russicus]MDR6270665.1 murein DD-endopeptidase MepM/ murein hydrolase activator NlpD [Arthrobacter russicus]
MRILSAARPAGWLLALLLAAWPAVPAERPDPDRSGAWEWPLAPQPEIHRPFDPPERDWLPGHRGVDLAAVPGQDVLSPAAGTVSFSGWLVDRYVLAIEHGGLRSSFEPVRSSLAPGQAVQRSQPIGRIETELPGRAGPPVPAESEPGSPTEATGPAGHCSAEAAGCLHWGVRRGQVYLDPLDFLRDRRPSVLLSFAEPIAAIRTGPGKIRRWPKSR